MIPNVGLRGLLSQLSRSNRWGCAWKRYRRGRSGCKRRLRNARLLRLKISKHKRSVDALLVKTYYVQKFLGENRILSAGLDNLYKLLKNFAVTEDLCHLP